MKLTEKLKTNMKGFTIIEVMIVLAIAGLIIAVVLVAVPQLQRNQRNEARRSVLNRIKTEIDNYSGNNQGKYPADTAGGTAAGEFGALTASATTTSVPTGSTFLGRYLSGVNVNDPSTGRPGSFTAGGTTNTRPTFSPDLGYSVLYSRSAQCGTDGDLTELTGASLSDRKYALSIALDGGAVYCIDNK